MIHLFILFSFFFKHEFHTSLTEINYNSTTKVFEVSMRVFSDDLELALLQNNPNISKNKINDQLILPYINRYFYLDADGEKLVNKFIGKEIEADITWLYFEIPYKGKSETIKVQNIILSDLFRDQSNIVNFKFNNKKSTLVFKGKDRPKEVI